MARMLKWIGLTTLSFTLTGALIGCVPQEKYNAKALELEQAEAQLNQAQQAATAANATAASKAAEAERLQAEAQSADALAKNLQAQNEQMAADKGKLEAELHDAIAAPPKVDVVSYNTTTEGTANALPADVTNALTEFARANPDLVEFDRVRGIVKFKSDVTFATGSSDLTPESKSVIDKFAVILASGPAAGYELMVAGHTDNVPVTNPETIRRGNLDNLYLSTHRAISVTKELISRGVAAGRIASTGYGDTHPAPGGDNNTAAGRKLNRRVEVIILPTRHIGAAVQASATVTPSVAPHRISHRGEDNKDSAPARESDNK